MEKLKMNLKDRLMALQLLPEKSDLAKLRIVHKARMKLAPSEQEIKEFELETVPVTGPDGNQTIQTKWNLKGSEPREIDLGVTAISMLKERLEELSKKKELTMDFLELCDKLKVGEE